MSQSREMSSGGGYGSRLSPGPLSAEDSLRRPDGVTYPLLAGIGEFWRAFIKAAFSTYHPEQHYMRGPGPACAAKRRTLRNRGAAALSRAEQSGLPGIDAIARGP